MTDPIDFDATTARFALPLLVAGQAQKEFYVNEAFARLDMLLHAAIDGELADPPTDPQPGQSWIVAAPASAEWLGHEETLASWDGAMWTFVPPVAGQTVYDRATGGRLCFDGNWVRPALPTPPQGGATVDAEARAAIAAIIAVLEQLGATG